MNFNTACVLVIVGACLAFGAPPRFKYSSTHLLNDYAKFSNELIRTILEETRGPSVVSPMSLAQILTIASCGAKDETLKELERVLHISASKPEVLRASRQLMGRLKGEKNVTISLLNSFIVNENYELLSKMMKAIEFGFQSKIRNEDFTDGERVANGINKYVEDGTHGTIKDLVTADMFGKYTGLVAVNVLYFQSEWSGFEDLPQPQNFRLGNKNVVQTPMIRADGSYVFHESDCLLMIKIPFLNEKFAMTIAMPRKDKWPTVPSLDETFSLMSGPESFLRVELPKFIIESKHDLVGIVTMMGAKRMFGPEAQFSGFTGKDGLYVSSLIQKAYINVTSGGVEASAATAMGLIDRGNFAIEPSRSVRFDRPFIAYITYESMPLFAMRVTDPRP